MLAVKLELMWLRRLRENTFMFELLIACLLSDLPELEGHPGVASVKFTVECDAPKLTIIHVRDWHLVEKASPAVTNLSGRATEATP
ncbi:MAG: hypothetical protein ACI8P0_002736 [Planctomycetaceae bacterium]